MGLDHLVDKAATVWRVPDVEADCCVHSQLETATCNNCLTACPRQAWIMDDDMLGIDMDACDGCALCVPVCPEHAILPDYHPEIREWRGEVLAFAACEFAVDGALGGRLPCVHALGRYELMQLHRRGVSKLIISHGNCGDCARGGVSRLDALVDQVNAVLESRGLRSLMLVPVGARDWLSLRQRAPDGSQPALNRRNFLRRATATAVDHAANKVMADTAASVAAEPPGKDLPLASAGMPAFFVPSLDAQSCNGCDACTRICPHGAIRLVESADAYELEEAACTGCGLCVDVCDQDAVRVQPWGRVPAQHRVALLVRRCAGCGASFHEPQARETRGNLCRICDQTGHFRNLFQVMK